MIQSPQNPLISQCFCFWQCNIFFRFFNIEQHEPRYIPQLVRKISESSNFFFGKFYIIAWSGADQQRKARGISSIFFNHVQRVNNVSQRFTHLSPLFISDQPMQIYGFKWNISNGIRGHENHARNPKK